MKLQCQVEVVNRVHSNHNIRSSGRYLKSTLAIGKEPKDENAYFILHFSSTNKSGTKYRVKSVKQVFVKCIKEGKATIRFEEPPHDLCIRSEALQLKCFMKILRSCMAGDTKNLQIATLSSLSVTPKDTAPTKLVIHNRSEYPEKGLPRTLETLFINDLKLCNFRRDILLLKQLVVLDMTNNLLEKIPPEIGRMPNLKELHVANNELGTKGEIDWRWVEGPQISKMLKLLDIGGNKLGYLPQSIWKLQSLVTLKLDKNSLRSLPTTIGRMGSLRFLTVTQNEITSLPCSLIHSRLEYLDISENMFYSERIIPDTNKFTPWECYVGNLAALASKPILKHKIHYAPNIIPKTLVDFLDNANMCVCGAPVVNNAFYSDRGWDLKNYFNIVVYDNNTDSTDITFHCYYCSLECFKR